VTWAAICIAFLGSHVAGDFLLQTEWQALHKRGGLGRAGPAQRALAAHTLTYLVAFVPALVWLAGDIGGWAVAVAAGVALPHAVVDDGRLVRVWLRRVKRAPDALPGLVFAVDQSFHLLLLLGLAALAAR
jgi:hypothetical protein